MWLTFECGTCMAKPRHQHSSQHMLASNAPPTGRPRPRTTPRALERRDKRSRTFVTASFLTILHFMIHSTSIDITRVKKNKLAVMRGPNERESTPGLWVRHVISDYVIFPLLGLPFCLIWLLVARIVSFIAPFLIIPAYFICRPFYWAVPLARAALASQQWVRFGCVQPAN